MNLRKILLRVVLWSLAIAAVVGAMAVLSGGVNELWRISMTTVITAVAAALLMPTATMLDKAETRVAGIVGTITIMVAFGLSMLLVWNLAQFLPMTRWHAEESMALSLAFVLICGIPAVALLRLSVVPVLLLAARVGVASAAGAFASLMIGVWTGTRPMEHTEWAGTAGSVGCIGLAIGLCLIPADAQVPPSWMTHVRRARLAGVLMGLMAMATAIYAIWAHITTESGLFITMLSACLVVAHGNLCLLAPLQRRQEWIRLTAIGAAVITAVAADVMVTLGRPAPLHDLLARCAGAAGVVASCASLALLVVVRINKRVVAPTVHLDDVKELSILCAGCGRKLILPVGRSACTMCRMEYEIRVQEPQCVQCGYSLYNLTSDRCPECGLVIHRGEALNPA